MLAFGGGPVGSGGGGGATGAAGAACCGGAKAAGMPAEAAVGDADGKKCGVGATCGPAERTHSVLFGLHNRTLVPI
jgi:hypothetical protein